MDRGSGGEKPIQPWESTADRHAGTAEDPAGLLRDMLLGRAGPMDGGASPRQIRFSSGFVLGGLALGIAGVGIIAMGQGQEAAARTGFRELGAVLGGSGLLVLLWGILAGLPDNRALRVIGLAGMVIGALGIAAFVPVYPQNWNRLDAADYSVAVLGTYVAGVVLLVGATFAALVSDFVLRMQVRSRLRGELGREPTDEEIQRDIDEALRRHKVTWGGVSPDEGRGLVVKVDSVPKEWRVAMPRMGRESVMSGEHVAKLDHSVERLMDFRGGRIKSGELAEGGMGSAADALRALRTAKAEAPPPTFFEKVMAFFGRKPAVRAPPGFEGPRAMRQQDQFAFEVVEGPEGPRPPR